MSSENEKFESNADLGSLPTFLVIGAMKCGTTSLHHYLSQHPEIFVSAQKELHYFVAERNWKKGITWYRQQFDPSFQQRGEISPSYAFFPRYQKVPERIHQVLGDVKIIYIVRDPIDRLISHYVHDIAARQQTLPFPEALANVRDNDYVWCSCYSVQLERYLQYFPIERFLVITQEALLKDRTVTLQNVYRFLGVAETPKGIKTQSELHRSRDKRRYKMPAQLIEQFISKTRLKKAYPNAAWHLERLLCYPYAQRVPQPVPDEDLMIRLNQIFRPDIMKLEALTGLSFEDWPTMKTGSHKTF